MLYSQLTFLLANLVDGDGPPTVAQREQFAELDKVLAGQVAAFDRLAAEDVAKLNEAAKKAPLGELVDIMDVGWACAYLATPFARRITGGTVYVDGGANIRA